MTLVAQDLAAIFNNLADAIEGGNTWRGAGTALPGIPGQYPTDDELYHSHHLTVDNGVSSTQWQCFDQWTEGRWSPSKAPAYWALDTHGEHRKITAAVFTAASGPGVPPEDATLFTVASAFTTTPADADVLTILQGFKRAPNWHDLDTDEGAADGFDRFFSLTALPGKRAQWAGAGVQTYQTDLRLRLRLAKKSRQHDLVASMMTNLGILRSALPKTTNYDATYIRAIIAGDQDIKIVKEDSQKIVAEDTYRLFYRLDTATA